MAVELRMPKLGMTMRKGIVAKWLKKEGEPVAMGEPIAEVMTEKITIQVESPGDGVLAKILVPIKQEVPVGALLAWIGAVDEEIASAEAHPQEAVLVAMAHPPAAATVVVERGGEIKASPAARRVARERGIDLSQVSPSGKDGRISSEDVLAYVAARETGNSGQLGAPTTPGNEPAASEAARRLAENRGVDLAKVAGSLGERRRITSEDVETYLAASANVGADVSALAGAEGDTTPNPRTIPLVGMRKMIADHLVESLHTAAQLTISLEVDATELVKVREIVLPGFHVATGIRPTYTDLLVVLVTKALQQHPILNSTTEGETIKLHEDVNMGVAVAIESGLIVPVISQAQKKTLGEISLARSQLARKAVEGRLSFEEIQGGTFTITNPGGGGSDISTPILNSPENAILGVGRLVKKPAVYNDEICIRQLLWLNVTFDHRAMDGVPVARFLETLNGMIQEPMKYLAY